MTRGPIQSLYGVQHAERLYTDPYDVWEHDIEPWADYVDTKHRNWIIEEWTARKAAEFTISPEFVAQHVADYCADEMGAEEAFGEWSDAAKHPRVIAAFRRAIGYMANEVNYLIAGEKIDTHTITIDTHGQPLLNGEPMFTTEEG